MRVVGQQRGQRGKEHRVDQDHSAHTKISSACTGRVSRDLAPSVTAPIPAVVGSSVLHTSVLVGGRGMPPSVTCGRLCAPSPEISGTQAVLHYVPVT